MPTPSPGSDLDPWRDVEGRPILLRCRVEQITVDPQHGALPCRLHQQGHVAGHGADNQLYVLFDRWHQLVALRPHHVRVLDTSEALPNHF